MQHRFIVSYNVRRGLVNILESQNDLNIEISERNNTFWAMMNAEPSGRLSDSSLASDYGTETQYEKKDTASQIACMFCADDNAFLPVKSLCCGQVIGCKNCVKRWYYTKNIIILNLPTPFSRSRGQDNHKSCPFCRRAWPNGMFIEQC
ncbi:hypothetical protein DdX_18498 [Ditylenchus destructor]|uniref:RING-type domain-containing protein n=1 Tax=Ditylenchus destructor TaxID=166010 RepID=A0AAD4MKR3_9BILA|nr:hypothetical protein DdX_18498 [Ditylenchus destructor]